MLESLLAHPLTLRLGLTLVHTLWQGLVLAGLLGLVLLLVDSERSRLRYGLATLTLLIWLATPVGTFNLLAPMDTSVVSTPAPFDGEARFRASAESEPRQQIAARGTGDTEGSFEIRPLRDWLPYVVLGWLLTASLLSLRLIGGLLVVYRVRSRGTPLPHLEAKFTALAARLGIRRRVSLLASTRVDVPTALGWLRPVVLLPVGAVTGLTGEQLSLILAHELAHIRRNDYLVNILQGVAGALLFYHPFTWWLARIFRNECEHACDDLALYATNSAPLALAEALTQLEGKRSAPMPALAATGNLARRVRRLLRVPQPTGAAPVILLPLLGTALLGLWLTLGAQAATPHHSPAVVIDPAHSDLFPGAPGPIAEEDLTLAVARKARELLEAQGVEVLLTREDDQALAGNLKDDLTARSAMATPEISVLITLHANFSSSEALHGIETFIPAPTPDEPEGVDRHQASRRLAEAMNERLIASTGASDRGVRNGTSGVLAMTRVPAVSIGLGFLSNPEESAQLATDEYQEQLAQGLADGVLAYLGRLQRADGESTRFFEATESKRDTEYFIKTTPVASPGVDYVIASVDAPEPGRDYFIETLPIPEVRAGQFVPPTRSNPEMAPR